MIATPTRKTRHRIHCRDCGSPEVSVTNTVTTDLPGGCDDERRQKKARRCVCRACGNRWWRRSLVTELVTA